MAKNRPQKLRLISAIAKTETAKRHLRRASRAASPVPCDSWIGTNVRKSEPCFANTDPVPFFLRNDDIVAMIIARARILSMIFLFRRGERASNTQQPTDRAGGNKRLVFIVFSPRLHNSSYPTSLSFACSFLVRRFWLIVVFPSSCATAGDCRIVGPEKK